MVNDLKPLWIDTANGVESVAEACTRAGTFALDTEADSLHSYFHKVCLIQVTVDVRHFVIDPLAVGAPEMGPLLEVLGDPKTTVLMHGADYDIRVLDRDFGGCVRGLQDTQIMAQMLGGIRTGLAALLEVEFGITLDKRYQRADWGRRPLTPAMLAYAAADTAYLAGLAGRLRTRLAALDRWSWVEEDCRRLEGVRYAPPVEDPFAFERVKGVLALRGKARDRAFSLWRWRESKAQRNDVPPFKILGNQTLVAMANEPPRTLSDIQGVKGVGPRFVRRNGLEVIDLLNEPEPAPPKRARRPCAGPDASVRARSKKLMAARDAVARDHGVEPGMLCPKATLITLAEGDEPVETVAQLETRGLAGWRLEVLGASFLRALRG